MINKMVMMYRHTCHSSTQTKTTVIPVVEDLKIVPIGSGNVLNSYYKSQLLGFLYKEDNGMNSPTQPGNIERFTISSNTGGGSIELSDGVIDFRYYESVLSNTVTANMHKLLRLVTVNLTVEH